VIGGKIVRKARTSANRSVRTVFRKATHNGEDQFAMWGAGVEPRIIQGLDVRTASLDGIHEVQ
jgi:hypothetical protein